MAGAGGPEGAGLLAGVEAAASGAVGIIGGDDPKGHHNRLGIRDWGLGNGGWWLVIGDWGLVGWWLVAGGWWEAGRIWRLFVFGGAFFWDWDLGLAIGGVGVVRCIRKESSNAKW